jgi:hypothetical protein
MAGVALAGFWAASSLAGTAGRVDGWELEQGVDPPSYAVIVPQRTDLNIDSVVLACEEAEDDRRMLQLQVYLSTEGPLSPAGVVPGRLKDDPRVEVDIDGRRFPAGLLFADDHVVIADETEQLFPRLSQRLLDALEDGKVMVLRFDLVAERAGHAPIFDGEAVIALDGGARGKAVAAVRRCASGAGYSTAAHARP